MVSINTKTPYLQLRYIPYLTVLTPNIINTNNYTFTYIPTKGLCDLQLFLVQ